MNQDSINRFNEKLYSLPDQLQGDVALVFEEISGDLPDASVVNPDLLKVDATKNADWISVLPSVLSASRFISGLLRNDASYLTEIIDDGSLFSFLDSDHIASVLATSLAATDDEQEIMHILRRTRNRAMLHIAFRDLAGWAPLDEVMSSISLTAEVLLSATLACSYRLTSMKSGEPVGEETGNTQQMVVLGMGKLGGSELNFSSDVDLIFCFPENGKTTYSRPITNSEFFIRQSRLFIKLLTTQTADGFVYRVDTRLRPNGDSGALCLSFAAMVNYYQLHGRDWERYAFIKANIVAGDRKRGEQLLNNLLPFVYRKYLDFAAVESIRDMKEMIERELMRKKELEKNIKLGPGGIREVEFIAQAHQLIRGGRNKNLQQRSLLTVLNQLNDSGLLDDDELSSLRNGYYFLRRCENRLQMYADQQTHNLPDDKKQQIALAHSMGFTDWTSFYEELQRHTALIHRIFHDLFMSTANPDQNSQTLRLSHLWNNELEDDVAATLLVENHYQQAAELYSRLQLLRTGSFYNSLSASARNRLDRLIPVLLHEVGTTVTAVKKQAIKCANTDDTILRCLDLLTSIARRPVYLSLLLDNEALRHQLIRLTSASPYISILLTRHPILLDDLLIGYTLADFDLDTLDKSLEKHLSTAEQGDLEQQMNLLREFHNSKLLGVASLDISTNLPAKDTGKSLSAIAEACVKASLKLSIHDIVSSHGTPTNYSQDALPFCVIAYGKLGSRELLFGSDLDLVFISASLPDSDRTSGPRKVYIPQFFARIGQRLVHIISTRTPAGRLYEVDMRLRPSGDSGPLVTTISHMQNYQRKKAWTWEHQALVRARVIAGDQALAEEFNVLRKEILTRPRDDKKLRKDIVEMREKLRSAKKYSHTDEFDLKQGHGGIVDIEFMVQYMVLRWAHEYPQLTRHTESLELLDTLAGLELLDPNHHRILSGALSSWLEKSYQLKLNDHDAVIPDSDEKPLRQQVTEIWNNMFARNNGS
ncbi:MAG: bifunctional [glutamate--ammonia ligase]-adenylyl-L-tyrosine phosphorylase/[glutamate--ammonia-ligase] adenylyltransferase [Arenicellales bacterium]